MSTISIRKISKGNNSAKNDGEQLLLISGRRLIMLYISTKFCEIFVKSQTVSMDTISIGKITMGNNSAKNAGGATVVNICTSSVMLYISTKFCEMI